MSMIEPTKLTLRSQQSVTIRTATPEDAQAVLGYTQEVLGEAPYLLTTREEFTKTVEDQRQFLASYLEHPHHLALLAEVDGEVIGFLNFQNGHRKRIAHQGELSMSLLRQWRGQGVGRALAEQLIQWAQKNPLLEKLTLDVFLENHPAVTLYERVGFVKEGIQRKAIKMEDGTYHSLIRMALFLDKE